MSLTQGTLGTQGNRILQTRSQYFHYHRSCLTHEALFFYNLFINEKDMAANFFQIFSSESHRVSQSFVTNWAETGLHILGKLFELFTIFRIQLRIKSWLLRLQNCVLKPYLFK